MSITNVILKQLQEKKTVRFPLLGVLFLYSKHAEIETDDAKIVPPKSDIFFREDPNTDGDDLFEVFSQHWKEILQRDGRLSLPGLGEFFMENGKISFTKDENIRLSDDFFDFEEVALPEMEKVKSVRKSRKGIFVLISLLLVFIISLFFIFPLSERKVGKFLLRKLKHKSTLPSHDKQTLSGSSDSEKN